MKPVSVGDDGRSANPPEGEGPLLTALKDFIQQSRNDYKAALRENRLRMRQALVSMQPAYAPQYANGVIPSSGNLVLDLGGPQVGRRWVVRMVTVSEAASFWTSMSSAQATICTGIKTGNTVTSSMVRWPFSSLPNAATFSSDQLWVNPRDHVLLSITGGTNGQNVQCTIWIQDFALESVPFSEQEV